MMLFTGLVTLLAGSTGNSGSSDGTGASASFNGAWVNVLYYITLCSSLNIFHSFLSFLCRALLWIRWEACMWPTQTIT